MYYFGSPYDDERLFNLPGLAGQIFGNQGQFPGGGHTGGQFPGGGHTGGGFPGAPSYPNYSPGFPGQPGVPGQPGAGGQGNAPTSPPPSFTPQQPQFQTFAVDPGAIRGCLYRNTYVWLENGDAFWFFPIFVGRNSISGFRWRFNHWVYFGIDLDRVASFQCY